MVDKRLKIEVLLRKERIGVIGISVFRVIDVRKGFRMFGYYVFGVLVI